MFVFVNDEVRGNDRSRREETGGSAGDVMDSRLSGVVVGRTDGE